MAMHPLHPGSAGYALAGYTIVFFGLAYFIGRFWRTSVQHGKHSFVTGSTLDQAEKGSLKQQEDLSDDDVFQLEKRAFFSKVGRMLVVSYDDLELLLTCDERLGYSYATAASFRSQETIIRST
jgi:hypothetical protein